MSKIDIWEYPSSLAMAILASFSKVIIISCGFLFPITLIALILSPVNSSSCLLN